MAQIFVSAVAHFFMSVGGSKIHERLVHFFIDIYMTMANETNFRKDIVASVKAAYGKHLPIMQAVIPATVRLEEISTADHT